MSPFPDSEPKVLLEGKSPAAAGPHTFATTIADTGMNPSLKPGDIVIVDPDKKPMPGQFFLSHIKKTNEIFVRKYRKSGNNPAADDSFELVAANADWGTITIGNSDEGEIIATVIEARVYNG